MKSLSTGKIPIEILSSVVLRMTGAHLPGLATPPRPGLDFAAVKAGNRFVVVSADPVTGVVENIGTHAIRVSANDVATSGNRPRFAESVILLPEGSTAKDLGKITRQIHTAAKELGIAIVGGHTEVTPGLKTPIVVATVFAFAKKFVTSGDAREGDVIMMTKTAGIEGTSAIATEEGRNLGLPADVLARARRFVDDLSIVGEAVSAYETGVVRAMHDCTEGGVLGAVFEMSLASGVGFVLEEKAVPVAPETKAVCRVASLDPLKLIGSGSLLLAVRRGAEGKVERALERRCAVTEVGRFAGGGRTLVKKDGERTPVRAAPDDELWRWLGRAR